jgi:hypothetical protein
MSTDKNGAQLFEGDEVVLRAKVTGVQGEHVLTVTVEPPNRELWFQSSVVERSAQGPASLDADKRANAAAAPAPGPIAVPSPTSAPAPAEQAISPREEAILHVMSHNYSREAAERIVEDHGTKQILADKADEEKEAAAAKAAVGTTGSAPGAATLGATTETANTAGTTEQPVPDKAAAAN